MSVGIKDIARALGISTGTVDRALHAKPGVNPATRARVLSMAAELGYQCKPGGPIPRWRGLPAASGGMHLPREIALFWDSLRESIREAAAPFAPALHVDFQTYPGLGEGDIPLFENALREGTNGLIVTPRNPAALKPYIDDAARRNIPVVCVVTDAPGTARLASVSAGAFHRRGRRRRAPLAMPAWRGDGRVLRGLAVHARACGEAAWFRIQPALVGGSLRLGPVVEAHDDEREAYQQALGVLRAHPDLTSIYVSTVNSLPVPRRQQEGRLPGLTIVTTDLFPELVERIRAGAIAATVYQRPLSQGRLALQTLYQFLRDGKRPPERIHVVPHLVMRSNLDLFLERLPVDLDARSREDRHAQIRVAHCSAAGGRVIHQPRHLRRFSRSVGDSSRPRLLGDRHNLAVGAHLSAPPFHRSRELGGAGSRVPDAAIVVGRQLLGAGDRRGQGPVGFYTSRKKDGPLCVAVADAARPQGPYTDRGPLVCQEAGSIDAAAVSEENGRRYLVWKEDGNSRKLPTPLWAQPLSDDGLRLVGENLRSCRNEAPWEAHLIEGPYHPSGGRLVLHLLFGGRLLRPPLQLQARRRPFTQTARSVGTLHRQPDPRR